MQTNVQLMGRPKYLNDRPEGRSNHRPEGLATEERCPFSNSGPPLRPERSLRSLADLRTASPTGRPGQSTTSDSDPRLRPRMRQTPTHCSSPNWRIQSRLGLTDRGRPLGKDQGTDGKRKAGRTSQNHNTRDRTLYTYINSTLQPPWHNRA